MLYTKDFPVAASAGELIAVSHPDGRTTLHAALQAGDVIEAEIPAPESLTTGIVIRRATGTETLMTVPVKYAQRHARTVAASILSSPPLAGRSTSVWKVAALVCALVWGVSMLSSFVRSERAGGGTATAAAPVETPIQTPAELIPTARVSLSPMSSPPTAALQQGEPIPSISTGALPALDAVTDDGEPTCLM